MRKFINSQRKIGPKSSSLSGKFVSRKQGNKTIQFESSLERDFILLCEFDNTIATYVDQPIKIKYIDLKGKKRFYTPDFYIQYYNPNRLSAIIEVKYSEDLKHNFDQYEEKFNQAILFCKNNTLTFSVLTEFNIRSRGEFYLKNISFLLYYKEYFRDQKFDNVNKNYSIDVCLELITLLRSANYISISSLIKLHYTKYSTKEDIVKYIWFLISNNYIGCNLNETLNKKSIIWVE